MQTTEIIITVAEDLILGTAGFSFSDEHSLQTGFIVYLSNGKISPT